MTRNAALGGIIIGGLTVIIWKQFKGGIFDLYEMVPAFIFSSIAIILISVIENKSKSMKDDTKEREFEGN
jgi:sodium/proline symporter